MQCLCPLFQDMAPECAHPGFYTDIHNFGCFWQFPVQYSWTVRMDVHVVGMWKQPWWLCVDTADFLKLLVQH